MKAKTIMMVKNLIEDVNKSQKKTNNDDQIFTKKNFKC